ncbi:pentatricopeptide repeat-containing protein At2g13600 [Lolium perenne]|uniref:pentatricopeptide repeat-containing protein At2g13600 n=1 Tax=Lolium perenne TaxID=4522 RepID=UPI0021EA9045|nr:pentatricopeptide repeat-containing protein At2g13600-like [Lolium perenne]XP_051185809.1 pentatricopeptide repeat-containing protein At2g13600-like [Lolium perenne]
MRRLPPPRASRRPPCLPAPTPAALPGVAVATVLPLIERAIAVGDVRRLGRAAHALLVKTALTHHTLLSNRLVELYAALPSPAASRAAFQDLPHRNAHSYNNLLAALSRGPATLPDALHLLDAMPAASRNAVSYNTVISALARHGRQGDALRVFARMARDRCLGPEVAFDRFAVVSAASACAGMGAVRPLQQLHGAVVASGVEVTVIMANAMLDAYTKTARMEDARMLFNQMSVRDTVSWTSMIAGYCRAKRLDEAVQVFGMMPEQDSIAWTALISGHEQNGEEDAALELFEQMLHHRGMAPTPFALVSSLGACAKLGLATRGKEVHGFILRHCIGSDPFNIFIHNALVDMYSKCGDMATATAVFERMPQRDFISWNSMVTGFSHNGQGKQSLAVFKRMLEAQVQPTCVTFLAALTSCSHAGLVADGRRILESMQRHGVEPRAEHYASFIDALGRNRQLEEASEFIKGLSSRVGPGTAGSWGALLGACRVHGNIEIAEKVAESLFQLEPGNSGRYVMLANIYAAAGQWDDARRVRALMKGKGLRKEQACSWIEVRSAKHIFVADDTSHCEANEIYEMLDKLFDHMHIVVDPIEDQLALR